MRSQIKMHLQAINQLKPQEKLLKLKMKLRYKRNKIIEIILNQKEKNQQ